MKEFKEYMDKFPFNSLFNMFLFVIGAVTISYMAFTRDYTKIVDMGVFTFFSWMVYLMIVSGTYQNEVIKPEQAKRLRDYAIARYGDCGARVIDGIYSELGTFSDLECLDDVNGVM